MTKKADQPINEDVIPVVSDGDGHGSTAPAELPRSIQAAEPSPLDTWVNTWAKSQTLPTFIRRLKNELQARGLNDPAKVEAYHLGPINAAIRAALQLDGHALLDAAQKARGEK